MSLRVLHAAVTLMIILRSSTCALATTPQISSDTVNSKPPPITLHDAEQYALKNNPSITEASHSAEAARQVVMEIRSGFFPQIGANAIYAYAQNGQTHIDASGLLTDSAAYTRQSDGLIASQLITDFGRTAFLTSSASFDAMARVNQVEAIKQFVLLSVDTAYYSALGAAALKKVADQEIVTNQLLLDQIKAFVSSSLRPQLDVSFQESSLAQARLLQVEAEGKYDEALANLVKAMGWREPSTFSLVETPQGISFPEDCSSFQAKAFGDRPDLIARRNELQASLKTAKAEFSARLPNVTALAAAGLNPYVGEPNGKSPLTSTYAVAGVNVSLPLFTGGRLSAKEKEAELRASALADSLKDYENLVFRDVRNAWVRARTSYRSIAAASDYVKASSEAFDLAQGRYTAGSSSIAEVSQAQVVQLQAEIALVSAQYEYQSRLAALSFESGEISEQITHQTIKKSPSR